MKKHLTEVSIPIKMIQKITSYSGIHIDLRQ